MPPDSLSLSFFSSPRDFLDSLSAFSSVLVPTGSAVITFPVLPRSIDFWRRSRRVLSWSFVDFSVDLSDDLGRFSFRTLFSLSLSFSSFSLLSSFSLSCLSLALCSESPSNHPQLDFLVEDSPLPEESGLLLSLLSSAVLAPGTVISWLAFVRLPGCGVAGAEAGAGAGAGAGVDGAWVDSFDKSAAEPPGVLTIAGRVCFGCLFVCEGGSSEEWRSGWTIFLGSSDGGGVSTIRGTGGAGSLVRGLVVPFGDEALLLCFCGGGADLCLLSPEGFGCVGVETLDRSIELADGSVAGTFLLAERVGFEDCPSGWLLVEKWDGIEGIGSVDTLCNPNPEGLPTIGERMQYIPQYLFLKPLLVFS
jgi:hypothetical protein